MTIDEDLKRLTQSFYVDRPKSINRLPTWDLRVVLQYLMFGPYEPLVIAKPKELTLKTAFLLALASGNRRSEINSWSIDNVKQIGKWSEVILGTSPNFLAKNQSERALASMFTPVIIKSLSKTLDKHDRALHRDRSLCPVRALRIYLERTKDIRKGRKKLFIAYKTGHTGEICAATISSLA